MSHKILLMLEMQNEMNTKVHPQWIEQNFAWDRAIWIECAELMDHHGWKWWKKQQPDIEQIKLELVDIWHFGLSLLIQTSTVTKELSAKIADELALESHSEDFLKTVEDFSSNTLNEKQFSVPLFSKMLVGMGMDLDNLFKSYVGKNVLNFFRQDHGYKDGTYIKVWNGKEDNEHLVEICEVLDSNSDNFKGDLYKNLENRYQEIN